MKVVLASSNAGKLKEFTDILVNQGLDLVAQGDFNVPDADETGLTFIENAILKARHAAHLTGLPAIADDSGIEVDALNGAPGIYSARFSRMHGGEAGDKHNNNLLLEKLAGVAEDKRTARFRCVIALMRHAEDPSPVIAQGAWEGRILLQPEGKGGFGYDPLFFASDAGCASALLDKAEKNRLSHRVKRCRCCCKSWQDRAVNLSLVRRTADHLRHFSELPPLSLYVHIPWCVKKCPYCDFNSHQQPVDPLPEDDYVDALLRDLEQELPLIWGRQLVSVFIGGGTPSLFSASAIDRLLSGLRALTALSPTVEITMEANPGTFEQERFSGFREAGINRLSIGVQSFSNESLQALGRIHNGDEAHSAVSIARKAGFDNINLDLMYGLPGQSVQQAAKDLETAISLSPEHVSYYQLTIEPNTLFAHDTPQLPDEERIWAMQEHAFKLLADNGYRRYEVSAFAQADKQSEHNLNYWLFGDYVGIGAGAHGKISSAASGDITRRWKQRHPRQYLKSRASAVLGGEQVISAEDTGIEFMMNALRLVDGFSVPLFQLNTGMDIYPWQTIINQAISDGLMEQQALQLRPSAKGLDFLNDLLDRFMPEQNQANYPVIRLWQE